MGISWPEDFGSEHKITARHLRREAAEEFEEEGGVKENEEAEGSDEEYDESDPSLQAFIVVMLVGIATIMSRLDILDVMLKKYSGRSILKKAQVVMEVERADWPSREFSISLLSIVVYFCFLFV